MSAPPSTFHIHLRRGIWRVTLDHVFYGDYRAKDHAVESAESGAQALRERGRNVQIVFGPDEAVSLARKRIYAPHGHGPKRDSK